MSELPTVYEYESNIADAAPPQPLPVGEYRATVRNIEAKPSKASGKPTAHITYFIDASQYPADYTDGNPDGAMGMFYLPLEDNPRNRWRIRQMCEMHGVVPSKKLNLAEFLNQDVIVKVEHEDYQGLPQARLTPVRAA